MILWTYPDLTISIYIKLMSASSIYRFKVDMLSICNLHIFWRLSFFTVYMTVKNILKILFYYDLFTLALILTVLRVGYFTNWKGRGWIWPGLYHISKQSFVTLFFLDFLNYYFFLWIIGPSLQKISTIKPRKQNI